MHEYDTSTYNETKSYKQNATRQALRKKKNMVITPNEHAYKTICYTRRHEALSCFFFVFALLFHFAFDKEAVIRRRTSFFLCVFVWPRRKRETKRTRFLDRALLARLRFCRMRWHETRSKKKLVLRLPCFGSQVADSATPKSEERKRKHFFFSFWAHFAEGAIRRAKLEKKDLVVFLSQLALIRKREHQARSTIFFSAAFLIRIAFCKRRR